MTADHYAIGEKLLALQLSWIQAADAKIAPVFGIDAAMLGVLVALAPPLSTWTIGIGIWFAIAFFGLGCSIFLLALATFPRLDGPPTSLHFFGGITEMTQAEYAKRMLASSTDELIQDIYQQVYRNAEIAKDKFYYIWWAMASVFGCLPFWLIAVWVVYP